MNRIRKGWDILGEQIVINEGYTNKAMGGSFKNILKSVALAMIVTFIVLILAALMLCFTDFPEKYTFPSAIAATVLGVLAGSYSAARKSEGNSMVSALAVALIYSLLAYITGCVIQGKFMISGNTALFTAITLLTGAIASILANRAAKTPTKYSGGSNYLSDKFKKSSTKGFKLGKSGN